MFIPFCFFVRLSVYARILLGSSSYAMSFSTSEAAICLLHFALVILVANRENSNSLRYLLIEQIDL